MPTKKKMGRQNYDWNKIKHDYVTAPQSSLRKIAEKYGISYTTVAKRSRTDNWFADRQECQSDIATKAISKTTDKLAKELADEADFLQLMKAHVGRLLKDEQQFHRHLVQGGMADDFETKEIITEKADARALKDTMQVLKMIEEMTRSLYNLQKAETLQKHQIDQAKLDLERERFEFEKEKAEMNKPDKSNRILIEGMEKGWAE